MSPLRRAALYAAATAGMAALGAAAAATIVALEERSSRRLGGDSDAENWPALLAAIDAKGVEVWTEGRPDTITGGILPCPDRCTCHGRHGERA